MDYRCVGEREGVVAVNNEGALIFQIGLCARQIEVLQQTPAISMQVGQTI